MQLFSSEEYRPLARIGQMPVYAVTLVTGLNVVGLFFVVLAPAGLVEVLAFNSRDALAHLHIWQFLTYGFMNRPAFMLLVALLFLYLFGRDVEQFVGWRRFLQLYGLLLVVPAFALVLWSVVESSGMQGCHMAGFGVFIAFATLYPRVELIFSIQARWVAWFFCGLMVMGALVQEQGNWPYLIQATATALTGHFYIRFLGFQGGMPWLENVFQGSDAPKESRRKSPSRPAKRKQEEVDLHASIDPLLEKISKQGIGSLTPKERERLEKARESLMKEDDRS